MKATDRVNERPLFLCSKALVQLTDARLCDAQTTPDCNKKALKQTVS